MVRSLGADHVIDYSKGDFTKTDERYDVVFDAVDKISRSRGRKILKSDGIFISVGKDSGEDSDLKVKDLEYLKELIEAGKFRSFIDRTYTLDQIVEAHRYVDKGHKKGNVIINVVSDIRSQE
jgi:NADPH:quinone reductase-like Zn-dependent oxidoreductase